MNTKLILIIFLGLIVFTLSFFGTSYLVDKTQKIETGFILVSDLQEGVTLHNEGYQVLYYNPKASALSVIPYGDLKDYPNSKEVII